MLKQKREEVTNLAAPSGIAETKTVTQEKLLEEFRRVSDLLAKAATQLRTLGYVPEPDGTYKQTPEAHRAEVYTLDLDDYPFRDAVRAENKTHSGGPALEHLYDEVERALEDLGEKFGVGGSDLSDDFDVVGVVRDALISLIENEAESDAELKAENDAELKAEEEANEVSEETPPTLSILRRKGKTQPGGAA